MIRGIGVDIVEVARFKKATLAFACLILTHDELIEFHHRKDSIEYLASRFAAKEAVVKAIGHTLSFQSLQVTNDEHGKPHLRFLATDITTKTAFLSISHERNYVVAMVILE